MEDTKESEEANREINKEVGEKAEDTENKAVVGEKKSTAVEQLKVNKEKIEILPETRSVLGKEKLPEKEISESELIEVGKERVTGFLKAKGLWIYYAILAAIVWLNLYIRTLPMKINPATGKPGLWDVARDHWTLGPDLDPFLFMRYAKYIAEHGSIMANDVMRYVPLGYNPAKETMAFSYLISYLYKFLNIFKEVSIEYATVIFPVVISVFTAIFFFLLVKKVFEAKGTRISNSIALISTAFLVILPSLLTRTIAGIPEKESIGFCIMFLSFYLFLSAWKSKKIRNGLILGVLAGASTALMCSVWGGAIFIFIGVSIATLITFILGKIEKKELLIYCCWLFTSYFLWNIFSPTLNIMGFSTNPKTGISVLVFSFMIVYFILFKTKLQNHKILQNHRISKIPKVILAIIITLVLLVAAALLAFGPSFFIDTGRRIFYLLIKFQPTRLISTVAESRQPYFSDWKGQMGPIFKGIPLFFWLFFIGSILLFYETVKKLKKKEKIILTSAFFLFMVCVIFSKISPSSMFNGENTISVFVNISGYIILLLAAGYVFYIRNKKQELAGLKEIDFGYLLIFSLIFIGIIAARNGIRFIMVLTPIATIPLAYFVVNSFIMAFRNDQNEIRRILYWILLIVVVLSAIYTFNAYYRTSEYTGTYHIPSAYTHQWQYAMAWVRENTAEDAVFGHWWDYGYWVQSIGERATMLDGGNAMDYWNYLMGRHVLTAETEEEALELLYNHDVTHFLIDPTDIGKYGAYSLIGSDEEYDRYSWIGTFFLNPQQTQETKTQIIYVYQGGVGFDEDIRINGVGEQILLPKQAAVVGGLIVYKNNDGSYSQPEAAVAYDNKQYRVPLRYLFINNELIDFGLEKENTFNACAYIFPRLETSGNFNRAGAALYLSPRNMRALWVRLYLLGEGENFNLVHKESSAIHKQYLIPQRVTMPTEDFVYYQGIQGPIKIWEIKYTDREKVRPEYLQDDYPEEIADRLWK